MKRMGKDAKGRPFKKKKGKEKLFHYVLKVVC
jgi:hypothetical protein